MVPAPTLTFSPIFESPRYVRWFALLPLPSTVFVELKKTVLGKGSKANHLTYLGDSKIGEKVNVGAGTITCNYNGYEKFTTVIDDGAFIGSDTQLIAPVKVGKRAVVAAGTTVTEDVAAGALVLSRVAQIQKPGYADKVAKK